MLNQSGTTGRDAGSAGNSHRRNQRVGTMMGLVAVGMLGMAYAAVPLYQMFCQATGYGGTTQRVSKGSDKILDRVVTVRFDANVNGISWTFEPVVRTVDVRIGENTLAFYRATNTSDRPLVGTSSFNVSPDIVGSFFNKMECFCFQEQRLEPGESIDLPVSFYVDPAIEGDKDGRKVKEITLSYTFYPVDKPKAAAAASAAGSGRGG
jgi:cytochrome c oxidase assembly protein subunit 11